jgi:hypothetical protein
MATVTNELAQELVSEVRPLMAELVKQAFGEHVQTNYAPSSPVHVAESAPGRASTPSNYVPITGTGVPLIQLNWHRAATIMQKLIMQTGIAKRLHSAIRNYIVGEGLEWRVTTRDETLAPVIESIQEVLDAFVNHPRNNLKQRIHQIIFEHSAFGETCIPVHVDEFTGEVILRNMPVIWISEVLVNPMDADDVITLKTQQGQWKANKRMKDGGYMHWNKNEHLHNVVRYDFEQFILDDTGKVVVVTDDAGECKAINPNYGTISGDTFYFRSNNLLGSTRGWGDSFQVMDLMQALDQFLFDSANRLDMQASVVWDLEVDGNDTEVQKWQNQPLPTGAKLFAHNKRVKLEAKSPQIKVEEFVNFIKLLRQLIAGSVGIPEYAMGYGGDTNVATEQAPVMNSEFNNRRTWWEQNLAFMFRFVVEQANKRGMLYAKNPDPTKANETFKLTTKQLKKLEINVTFKPFNRSDLAKMSEALAALANALMAFEEQKYITHDVAMQVARQALATFGIDVSQESEEATLEDEANPTEVISEESGEKLDYSVAESIKQ